LSVLIPLVENKSDPLKVQQGCLSTSKHLTVGISFKCRSFRLYRVFAGQGICGREDVRRKMTDGTMTNDLWLQGVIIPSLGFRNRLLSEKRLFGQVDKFRLPTIRPERWIG
jgi:hypothetical protein